MTESSSRYIIAARSQHFFTKGQQELVDWLRKLLKRKEGWCLLNKAACGAAMYSCSSCCSISYCSGYEWPNLSMKPPLLLARGRKRRVLSYSSRSGQ
jgi:hypothetical protein